MGEQATGRGDHWLSDLKGLLAPIVALLVLLGFSVFVIHMLGQVGVDETQWTRALYLLAGVEAIAFAAAGFFFGSEIRRQQVESTQEQVENTQEQLDQAQDQVRAAWQETGAADNRAIEAEVKGRALATAIRAETVGLRRAVERLMRLDTEDALKTVEADLGMLETLANELFPPED